jgi:uncharacterized protein YjbI with pentapeptide repeats
MITDGNLYRSSDEIALKGARITIRAQTLAVLTRLSDPYRKASVLQFMYEAGLIDGEDPFLSLLGANLQGVNLRNIGSTLDTINLKYASLNRGIFTQATMPKSYLYGADLSGADLTSADLTGSDLRGVNLTDATLEVRIYGTPSWTPMWMSTAVSQTKPPLNCTTLTCPTLLILRALRASPKRH